MVKIYPVFQSRSLKCIILDIYLFVITYYVHCAGLSTI